MAAVVGGEDHFEGRGDAGLVATRVEEQLLRARPAVAEVKLSDLLSAEGLAVEDPAPLDVDVGVAFALMAGAAVVLFTLAVALMNRGSGIRD